MQYSWSCTSVNPSGSDVPSCSDAKGIDLLLPDVSILHILQFSRDSLKVFWTYVFTLTVSKGASSADIPYNLRRHSTTARVKMTAGDPPVASILPPAGARRIISSKYPSGAFKVNPTIELLLQGSVMSKSGDGRVDLDLTQPGKYLATPLSSVNLKFKALILSYDVTYAFQLTIKDSNGDANAVVILRQQASSIWIVDCGASFGEGFEYQVLHDRNKVGRRC
jgi:hypothetical protein